MLEPLSIRESIMTLEGMLLVSEALNSALKRIPFRTPFDKTYKKIISGFLANGKIYRYKLELGLKDGKLCYKEAFFVGRKKTGARPFKKLLEEFKNEL